MNLSQYRLLQVCVLAFTVSLGATACSKQKTEGDVLDASAPEQTQTSEVQATEQHDALVEQQPDATQQSADYYKPDNKERVAEENDLLDEVSTKK